MKKGQVTIFIIVGILIVASASLFFALRAGFLPQLGGGKPESNVNAFLNTCLEGEIRDAIDLILINGGYTQPKLSTTFLLDGKTLSEINYLCYAQGDYDVCLNQEPMLFESVKNEIKEYTSQIVENCFYDMVSSFERQGNDVSSEYNSFEVLITPKKVEILVDSKVTLTRTGETTIQENFKVTASTRLYELLNVVQKIINKEATDCNFNHQAYELFYPEFDIEKTSTIDSSDIYTVEHDKTKEKFIFATRGCVIPPV